MIFHLLIACLNKFTPLIHGEYITSETAVWGRMSRIKMRRPTDLLPKTLYLYCDQRLMDIKISGGNHGHCICCHDSDVDPLSYTICAVGDPGYIY